MKSIVLLFLAFLGVMHASPNENHLSSTNSNLPNWVAMSLKLSQAATLLDVFDSGIRPYRHPGLENSLLEAKHLRLRIQLGSGKELPEIPLEVINFTPFRDDEISTIEGFSPPLDSDAARREMLKWLPYAGNGRTESDLNQYVAAAAADFIDFDDPYHGIPHGCSVQWNEPKWKQKGGGPQVVVWFRKTADAARPLRLYLKLSWSANRPSKGRGSYRPDFIAPPIGYENVDMSAPADFGPDSVASVHRSVDRTADSAALQILERKINQRESEKESGDSPQWSWLLFFLVMSTGLLGAICWHRYRSP
jgi:hypothetical protein